MSDNRTATAHGLSNIPASQDSSMPPISWYGQNWYPQPRIPPVDVNIVSTPVSIAGQRDEDLLKRIAELELRVRRIEDVQRLGKRR